MDTDTIRAAHDSATLYSVIAIAAGGAIGAAIGLMSKKSVPGWQIVAFAVIIVVVAAIYDSLTGAHVGPAVRTATGAMAVALFITRPSEDAEQ